MTERDDEGERVVVAVTEFDGVREGDTGESEGDRLTVPVGVGEDEGGATTSVSVSTPLM